MTLAHGLGSFPILFFRNEYPSCDRLVSMVLTHLKHTQIFPSSFTSVRDNHAGKDRDYEKERDLVW